MAPETPNRILLVEDNPSDVALARRAFQKVKLVDDLVVAEDGQEALDYLSGNGACAGRHPSDLPDLVFLDLKLPKVPGLEVLRKIRASQHTRRIPVVIFTSSIEEEDRGAAYDLGVNSYVRKPVDSEQFNEAIKQLSLYWLNLNKRPPRTA